MLDLEFPILLHNKYQTLYDKVLLLYDAIKHGDEEHKRWLKEKIDAHFNLKESDYNS